MVTQQQCAQAYRQVSRVTIGATKLCAGEGTRDTCNGDSGGGLFSRWVITCHASQSLMCISETLVGATQLWEWPVLGLSVLVTIFQGFTPGKKIFVYWIPAWSIDQKQILSKITPSPHPGWTNICRGYNRTWARYEDKASKSSTVQNIFNSFWKYSVLYIISALPRAIMPMKIAQIC